MDFESFNPGDTITTQIAGLDITNGAIATDPVIVLGDPLELDTNGENTLFNVDPTAPIVIDFDPPVTGLQLEGAAFAGNISVDAFDEFGNGLAFDNFTYGDPDSDDIVGDIELNMVSSARNISQVVITYEASAAVVSFFDPGPVPAFVIDDLAFVWRQLVDFEGLANSTVVTDQFEGVEVSNGIIVEDPVDVLGIPTDLDPNGENTLGVFPDTGAPITFTFDEPASNISLELAAFAGTFTVNSFDAGGGLIDSEVFAVGNVIGLNIPLSVSGASSIEVRNSAGYVVDDLAFMFGADPTITITNDAPANFPVGVTTVTFTATDAFGNSSSCSANVRVNTRPVAVAGGDQVVECTGPNGASVTLNSEGSFDPDGDSLSFEWYHDAFEESALIGTTPTLVVTLPLGEHTIALRVIDAIGEDNFAVFTVTVEDTTPPEITSSVATPHVLWPANHKMHEVVCAVTATDICTPAEELEITLESITSNEFDNGYGVGDGNTSNDIQVAEDGTISLRAERQGKGDGRIYTIVFSVTDGSGNSTEATCTVEVPHDQSAHSCDNADCDLNNS